MPAARPRIPVNVIAGPLGSGKTTTIRHLLAHRPEGERWAVLVNEYGRVGLDGALLDTGDDTGDVVMKEVAGGCICCSAGVFFDAALVALLRQRPDRLLIEPTGLAALSGVLDTLDRPGIGEHVDVRSIVCLVDPARLDEALHRPESRDQIEAADVLLASRSDAATAEQVDRFDAWVGGLFPPKKHVGRVLHGRIDVALLDLVREREAAAHRAGHGHEHGHDHDASVGSGDADAGGHGHGHGHGHGQLLAHGAGEDGASGDVVTHTHASDDVSSIGWVCAPELVFDAQRFGRWLHDLMQLPSAVRLKAVVHTNRGWRSFNHAHGAGEVRASGYRRDTRIEVLFDGPLPLPADTLERVLRTYIEPAEGAPG